MQDRDLSEQDEPLFLDEAPDAPRPARPASASIAELFADEDGPNPWTTISGAPRQQEAAPSGSDPAASAGPVPERKETDQKASTIQRINAPTVLLLILLAAVIGFSAVSAIMR
jgi:hypothetical protein